MVQFQASGFLVSSSHTTDQETELDENVYSNDNHADTASLLEQVTEQIAVFSCRVAIYH